MCEPSEFPRVEGIPENQGAKSICEFEEFEATGYNPKKITEAWE